MSLPITLIAVALLVRWLVAQFPYSGQASPPMYGDYEAQRHWMEITNNLPVSDWYSQSNDNDLQYWGLDYPPLTAYHMFALGHTAKNINSSWIELNKSRGLETYEHKIFMRLSVLVSEIFVYVPAILYYFYRTQPHYYNSPPSSNHRINDAVYTALLLLYPAQILIDHGHFQYNNVFMGLTLWAIILMIKEQRILAAIMFTLALLYKQMALYYSMSFFWYLASLNLRVKPIWKGLRSVAMVGVSVVATAAIILSPYIHKRELAQQVLLRIFPISRGLYEDKVANFWYSLSLFYKYRDEYSINMLLKASTLVTLLTSLPSGIHLLWSPTIRNFKYSLVTNSLAFFLFSFQVHEKTILLPALPILLMSREHPLAANWFIVISTFSLQPLLSKDGQTIPYFVLLTIFTSISFELFKSLFSFSLSKFLSRRNLSIIMYFASVAGCAILSIAAIIVAPPAQFPHLHAAINALYCSAHFIGFFIYFYIAQFRHDTAYSAPATDSDEFIKKSN